MSRLPRPEVQNSCAVLAQIRGYPGTKGTPLLWLCSLLVHHWVPSISARCTSDRVGHLLTRLTGWYAAGVPASNMLGHAQGQGRQGS